MFGSHKAKNSLHLVRASDSNEKYNRIMLFTHSHIIGEGISSSNPPLDVNVRLLTEFSKWALYHNMTAATVAVTPVQTSVITPTTVTDDQPPIITPESFLVPPPLSLNQTAVQGPSPSPSPAESLSQSTYGVTIALVVAITLILLIISVFVIVLTRGICCPRNRKKLARCVGNVYL